MWFKTGLSEQLNAHRMLLFLCCMLLLIISFPFIHQWYSNYLVLIEALFILLLVMGIYGISHNTKLMSIALLIAILSAIISWFNYFIDSRLWLLANLVLQIGFFTITTSAIITHVLSYKHVSADAIYGAISAYLLIGIIWAFIYTALELAQPGSFKFPEALTLNSIQLAQQRFYFAHFFYFSLVTLTTLGYGDMVPLTLGARGFASLEAIAGQLYIAVLIARLVGLHISHTHWERSK